MKFIALLTFFAAGSAWPYFLSNYQEARSNFRTLSDKLIQKYSGTQTGALKVQSKHNNDLTIDYLYIPGKRSNEKLLVITSGVHGVEGHVGSALQRFFLKEIYKTMEWKDTGILIVHSVNPWGFFFNRRQTENNVDLNRNFHLWPSNFKDPNPEYALFDSLLNPREKYNPGILKNLKELYSIGKNLIIHGKPALKKAVLQGQYSFPKGIFYGGKQAEPHVNLIQNLYTQIVPSSAKFIFFLDFHTGYGERGKLHFFGQSQYSKKTKSTLDILLMGETIESGNHGDFYTTYGDYTKFVAKLFPTITTASMTYEFGTLDSQSLIGSLKSLRRISQENQLYHHGGNAGVLEVKKNFIEMFYPSQKEWRDKVIKKTKIALLKLSKRIINLKLKDFDNEN